MEIRRIILTLASRHSRSLKVTGNDMDRSATYDFLLVIHSNDGSRTTSEIKSDNCKILPPHVFNAPLRGSPWNFVTALGLKKARTMSLPHRPDMSIPALDRQTDGQTDGQICHNNIARALHALHVDAR